MSESTLVPPQWPEYTVPLHPMLQWTPIDRDAPIAYVRLTPMKGRLGILNFWVVLRCPYCGKRHEHGAGEFGEEPRQYLGGRKAHCHPMEYGRGEYRLVEWTGEKRPPRIKPLKPEKPHRPIRVHTYAIRPPLSREMRSLVWEKTRGICWYCGRQTNPFDDFRVDHMKSVAHGGTNALTNLVPCCHSCNSSKGKVSVEVFRSRCPYPRLNDNCFWFERKERPDDPQ